MVCENLQMTLLHEFNLKVAKSTKYNNFNHEIKNKNKYENFSYWPIIQP